MGAKKDHYVKSADLEKDWLLWIDTKDDEAWQTILSMVYKICFGATLKFSPREDSEREEMAHDAFVATTSKIRDGKLKYVQGRGSAFNLVTTAVIRHIQSRKNREKAGKRVHERYIQKQMGANDSLRSIRALHRGGSRSMSDPSEEHVYLD